MSGLTISFQDLADYRPPIWPGSEVPIQLHLDFFVDSLDEAQEHAHTSPRRSAVGTLRPAIEATISSTCRVSRTWCARKTAAPA